MRLIEPKAELWSEENTTHEEHIARCARVCYGREGAGKDPRKLVGGLIKAKHLSMLRHATHYYSTLANETCKIAPPYTNYVFTSESRDEDGQRPLVVSVNGQAAMEYASAFYFGDPVPLANLLEAARDNPRIFSVIRLTFCLTTQISTSRELNRVSPNNIAERSTRYTNSKNGITICRPHWWDVTTRDATELRRQWYAMNAWKNAEDSYINMINDGVKPEDARGVLPLDTATKVVYTYSVAEWQHILDLRYYEKTGKPHPNAKIVMGMVRDQINDFAKQHGIDHEV